MNDEKTKIRQEQLIELVSTFCDDKLDDEYKHLSIKLVEKMGRKHDVPFKRGKLDIWASAVIYALGQINFLFDASFEPHSTPDEICDYFGTKKSTVSDKARKIRDMFNLTHFDKEFSTAYIKGEAPVFEVDEKSGMIMPHSAMDDFFDDVYNLFADGRTDEAMAKLDTIDEDDPEYARALFYKSILVSSTGDYDTSNDLFSQSLAIELGEYMGGIPDEEIDYGNPGELFAMGILYYNEGDFIEALEFFDHSLDLEPNDDEVIYYKSLALAGMGEFKKAVKTIDKAIKINPDDDRFWNDKGNFLTRLHHVDKALKCFNKAIELNPEDSVIWANKGFFYIENEKYDEALKCYDKAQELSPDDIHPIIGKVNACIAKEDFNTAQKYLDEAAAIDDEDVEYLSTAAQLEMNKHNYEKAIEYWDKCIEIEDDNPLYWVYKGFMYGMMDEEDKLDECLEKAIEIDPMIMFALEEVMDDMDSGR